MTKPLKYFGTDGIRGEYGGEIINEQFAFSLGVAFARFLEEKKCDKSNPILLAQDTRPSGKKLLASCLQGLQQENFQALNLGILSTPALAFSIINQHALGGIMVTASHNPHTDNGLKIISNEGGKLSVDEEIRIESFISLDEELPKDPVESKIHKAPYVDAYIQNLKKWFKPNFLADQKIVIDLANGATTEISPLALEVFGAEVICINGGDGLINDQVGSEFTDGLSQRVVQENADLGLAHDGDGDRIVFVDKKGVKIDGDQILGILAIHAKRNNSLQEDGFVATIHSNSGLEHSLTEHLIKLKRSDVGDRNVFALMQEKNINWGGESSGHIICSNYLNTGDGLFSALSVMQCMEDLQSDISVLAKQVKLWPSMSVGLKTHSKKPVSTFENLNRYLKEINLEYRDQVRVLIRYSGTEPKLRLLVEAKDEMVNKEVFLRVKELVSEYI
jgi:phosphoglucosamine mutase